MKIKINNKLSFNSEGRTLIIAEVSANHCGSKQKFLQHIRSAKKMVQIIKYKHMKMIWLIRVKLNQVYGKITIYWFVQKSQDTICMAL